MGEEVERRLQESAYQAYLGEIDKLSRGELTKEEFARNLAKKEFENLKDSLTGLFNRKFFNQEIELQLARTKRQVEPLSLLMVDLDNLKGINDTYGHLVGDAVLVSLGKVLKENIRKSDVAARFGGEEFAILLPATKRDGAIELAERLIEAIHQASIETERGELKYTASIGITGFNKPSKDLTVNELIKSADEAAYQAKNKGKDRIEVYG